MIAIALAAALAVSQSPAPRPAAELHCVYDSTPAAGIARAGEIMWDGTDLDQPVQPLIEPARACVERHGWSLPELQQAYVYALGSAAVRHVRTQLAQSLPVARWDAIYEATPVAERLRREAPPGGDGLTRGIEQAIEEDRAVWSDDVIGFAARYFVMRSRAERAERWWAGLRDPD